MKNRKDIVSGIAELTVAGDLRSCRLQWSRTPMLEEMGTSTQRNCVVQNSWVDFLKTMGSRKKK
jgi:hypothetical protein